MENSQNENQQENLNIPNIQQQTNQNTQQQNNQTNQNNASPSVPSELYFRTNFQQNLNKIDEYSNRNDQESHKYFTEEFQKTIIQILSFNPFVNPNEFLKEFMYLILKYLGKRCMYFDTMEKGEYSFILKLLDPNYSLFFNSNPTMNEVLEKKIPELYNQDYNYLSCQSNWVDQSNQQEQPALVNHYDNLVKLDQKKIQFGINGFYKYYLKLIYSHTNFFENIISHIGNPLLDFDTFAYSVYMITKTIYIFEKFNVDLRLKLAKFIINMLEKMEDVQIKEINKYFYEGYLRYSNHIQIVLIADLINEIETTPSLYFYKNLLSADLRLILVHFNSQNLEKRINSIKMLNEIIQGIHQNEKRDVSSLDEKDEERIKSDWAVLRKKHVLEWLDKTKFFELIFGENIHEAVLKKSSLVIVFLYINDAISFEHIDFIWKLAQDKHEAVTAAILGIFSDLISSLSIDHAMHVLKEVNEIPFKEVNDTTLRILESFANNKFLCVNEKKKENIKNLRDINDMENDMNRVNMDTSPTHTPTAMENGFDQKENNDNIIQVFQNELKGDNKNLNVFKSFYLKIIWKLSSEKSYYKGLSPSIINKARRILSTILIKPVFKYEFAKYIKKFIMNIKANHYLTTNLTIFDKIIKNLNSVNNSDVVRNIVNIFSNEIKDVKSLISYLDKQYNLLSIILNATLNLKKECLFITEEIQTLSLQGDIISQQSIQEVLSKSENRQDFIEEESKEIRDSVSRNNNYQPKNTFIQEEFLKNEDAIDTKSQVNNNNLNETLSTEKSMDRTISTISTDISPEDQPHHFLIKNFFEKYGNNKEIISKSDMIIKKLSLNYSNTTYNSILLSLLGLIKFFVFNSDVQFKQKHIEFLFEVLVENSIDLEEINLFYQFLADIIKYQHLTRNQYFNDEILYFVFFDLILKNDLVSLPLSGFVLFKQMFFLLNINLNVLKVRTHQIFEISDFSLLLGFESLWQIYLVTNNALVAKESLEMIVNLINSISKGDESSKSSFLYIFEKTFNCLGKYYELLKNGENVNNVNIDQAIRLINLLFIVNSNKQKFEKTHESEIVTIKLINNYYSDGNKIQLSLPINSSIKEVRREVAKRLTNPNAVGNAVVDETMISLFYKGKILENERQSLRDVRFENNGNIIVSKSSGGNYYTPIEIEDSRLIEMVRNIKDIFEDIDDEIIKIALKKNNYNIDDTIVYLTDENNVQSIARELAEQNTLNIQSNVPKSFTLDMFTTDRLKLLLDLLNLNISQISSNIWQLLSAIKYPESFINDLIDSNQQNFSSIFDYSNPNMMLLNIRLLNCLIFNDKFMVNVTKVEDSKISEWKMNLMCSNGIKIVIETISEILRNLQDFKDNPGLIYRLQILQILTKWLHFLTFSATISLAHVKDTLGNIIKMIIQKRPQGISPGFGSGSSPSKDSSPSHATPTFGSRDSSFSDTNKPQIKKALITGAEEYDSNYEEEIANSLFISLIESNFHLNLFTFAKFASDSTVIRVYSQDNESIYLNLIEILIVLTEMNPVAFKEIIDNETSSSLLINILFVEKSKFVRKMIENLFILLSQIKLSEVNKTELQNKTIKSVKELIIVHILNNYKRIYSDQVYEEFFILFGHFLQSEKELQDYKIADFNINEITKHILENIVSLSKKKDSELKEIQQEQLTGNIYLLQCMCSNNEQMVLNVLENMNDPYNINFIAFLYENLFGIESDNNVSEYSKLNFKYSNRTLRSKVYNLLNTLVKPNEAFKLELGERLLKHHRTFSNTAANNIDLDINIRSSLDKFIGLRNYGATCYMNSLLQQLYMIKEFRSRLYEVPIDMNSDLENNPLYHLQLVFANLSQTLKLFHTPIHFIKSIKGFNNQPINTSQQQDCEEFLNILIDRLEPLVKDTPHEKIFDATIRGRIAYEICSLEKEYPYYSENVQPCIAISLDIKNKRNIEEALDLFVKGENLVGENKYLCDKYDKKIGVLKRCSIKKLSEIVIIHLKRFEFDYNTFEKIKINDYCEFPMTLDFRPWMWSTIISQNKEDPNFKDIILDDTEINDPDSFKYQLAGVLVHSGTSECGHYYSFIHSNETEKWYRFDDTRVTEFNVQDLKMECFGSEERENTNEFFQRSRNAYLLLYMKVNSSHENKTLKETIPETLISQINAENRLFLTNKTYLDLDYFNFLRDYLDFSFPKGKMLSHGFKKEKSMCKLDRVNEETYNRIINMNKDRNLDEVDPESLKNLIHVTQADIIKDHSKRINDKLNSVELKKKLLKMATYYYFEILIKNKDVNKINNFTIFLIELIEINSEHGLWFLKKLTSNQQLFLNVLLIDNTFEVREGIYKLITNCLNFVYFNEDKYIKEQFKYFMVEESFDEEENRNTVKITVQEGFRSSMMRFFLKNMIGNFDTLRLHWLKYHQFLHTFNHGMNFMEIVELSLSNNILRTIISFIMNNQQPFETKFPKMGTNNTEPNFTVVIDILANLITSCIHQGVYDLLKYSIYTKFQERSNKTPLPVGWEMLLEKQILFNNILRKYSTESSRKIIHHLSWGQELVSKKIIDNIMQTLKENIRDINSINNMISNLSGLLEIDDMLKGFRIRNIFALDDVIENECESIYNYLLSFRDDMPLNTLICLKILGDHIIKFNEVSQYVSNNISKLEWIFYFLRDIDSDMSKRDNLQIEASADGINFMEVLSILGEVENKNDGSEGEQQYNINKEIDYQQMNEMEMDMESDMKNRGGSSNEPYP